ncbi:MAG: glycosyltransferase [Bacteroidota bacterium]
MNTTLGGGAGLACLRLHNGLRSIGIDSQTLSLYGETFNQHHAYLKNSVQKAQYRIKNKIRRTADTEDSFYPLRSYEGWYNLNRHALVRWADIVHLHWVADFLDAPQFLKHCAKPVVWTLHDEHPLNGWYHYSEGTNQNKYAALLQKQKSHLAEACKKENLHWVGPSNWICQQAMESGLIEEKKIDHIPNALPAQFSAGSKQEEVPNFLFVSAYLDNPAKGFDLALTAFQRIKKQMPSAQLQVIGHGNAVQVEAGVHYHGFKSPAEIVRFYQSADALLFPSRIDNYPNTILEAQACGCPVIALSRGGISEMIQSKVNGLITTIDELPIALLKSLDVDWDRQQISAAVLAKHDPKRIAEKYKTVYQGLLSR